MTTIADTEPAHTARALILCPFLPQESYVRSPAARSEEAIGLAMAIDLTIVDALNIDVRQPQASTLFGKGKTQEIAALVKEQTIGLVVVDHPLTPGQQRELEKQWQTKVIDRTALILEIFGARARTREGQLQVELAALNYQRSRLVRSWTHLERQRGGFGFLGGPGESQLEIDRRLIDQRLAKIEASLDNVKRTRGLNRQSRTDPLIALVGYTNAGKSTLFNRLSQADVKAANMLFATLDPTIRKIVLPSGWPALISDTVGFISDLPTSLVAAFSATLEEVLLADIILHVRDIAHTDSQAQRSDVLNVLEHDLGIEADDPRLIEVLNKGDLLPEDADLAGNRGVVVSALTGQGLDKLLGEIDRRLAKQREIVEIDVDLGDGKALAQLYETGRVLKRTDQEGTAHVWVERLIR